MILCLLTAGTVFANDFDNIMRGINSGISALSNLNSVRQQFLKQNTDTRNKQKDNTQNVKNQALIEIRNIDGSYTYKTQNGKILFNKLYRPLVFENGLAVLDNGTKRGLVDTTGRIVVPLIYDAIDSAGEGTWAFFLQVMNGVKIGYLDSQGNIIVEPMLVDIKLNSCYSYDFRFYNGLALYRRPDNYKFGYIDKTGRLVIDTIYHWAEPFKEEITAVSLGDGYGYIDRSGKVVLPFRYTLADAFSDGLAAVYDGNTEKWGYIDKTGNTVIPPRYGSFEGPDGEIIAYPFVNGITGVYLGEGQAYRSSIQKNAFALIDKTGKILKKYDSIFATNDDRGEYQYFVVSGDKSYILDSYGKIKQEL